MSRTISENQKRYLTCERRGVFQLLMVSGGMMGAYTYMLRGGVFCNAQTANFVLMAMALGQGNWSGGLYYLIPISAYVAGAFVSELLPVTVRKIGLLRWDTYLIGAEILVLFAISFIPLTVTDRVVQVLINFICSMQYNTFRQAEGIPMATTFCTNHVRQIGICLAKYAKHRETAVLRRSVTHLTMVACFLGGAIVLTALCAILQERAIWIAILPLLVDFLLLAHADIFQEKDQLDQPPGGH
ncbi:MAG: DUF1275 domain-containing protein [Lachnospiraceae bacterium]|nr:DUF1275 domain-containing protein [Lachnospiraceae bacterium]